MKKKTMARITTATMSSQKMMVAQFTPPQGLAHGSLGTQGGGGHGSTFGATQHCEQPFEPHPIAPQPPPVLIRGVVVTVAVVAVAGAVVVVPAAVAVAALAPVSPP